MNNRPPRSIARSILAILAGFVFVVVLSIGTDLLLARAGVFPSLNQHMSNQ